MTRLTAEFWVHAYLARLRLVGIPAFVVAHGDDTGGAVLVKLNTLDGQATVYQRFNIMIINFITVPMTLYNAVTIIDLACE